MCDQEKLAQWALSRRSFGAMGGAGLAAACAPMAGTATGGGPGALREQSVSFATADGTMDGFFVHPRDRAAPGVLFWPDIAGLREAKRSMARRLAASGYAVFVANPYYRDVSGEQFADFAAFVEREGFQAVRPWRAKLDAAAIMRDAGSAIGWLDSQQAVDRSRGIGTQGYCMGGPFTVWTAAAVPDRVGAAASFHGGGLVREDSPTSPHRMLQSETDYLIAIAQDDDAENPQHKAILSEAAAGAGADAEIEVYAGDHGWTVPDSPAYAPEAAERAWANLLQLYTASL
ncbi:dienelactone hydrolase family protein [Qipengyuania sp. MTN3-11]|uniref:dienelactone hydrolase family protein n=1 Tax=Qipengyuania sp. MTN3-11 TaxID=3056557 RepID=UPI0036F31905